MKIQKRLLISILPVVLITVAVVVGVSIRISTSAVEKQAIDNGQLLSISYSDQLNAKISQYKAMSKDLASAIVTAVNVETVLLDAKKRYSNVGELFYTSTNGNVLDMAPYNASFKKINFNKYEAFSQSINQMQPILSDPLMFHGEEVILLFSPVILHYVVNKNPEVVGVAVLVIPTNELFSKYKDVVYGDTGAIFISNRNGVVISHKDSSFVMNKKVSDLPATTSLSSIQDAMVSQASGLGTYYLGQEKRFISFAPIVETGWSMAITGSYKEFSKYSISLLLISIVILLIGLTLSAFVIFYVVRGAVKPIISLTDLAEKINKGDMSLRSNITSRSEVGILSKAINSMLDRLTHYNEILEKEVDERTKELQVSNEKLEAANEEMESVNEELNATVEELDGKNKILAELNHEMGAMNEELKTTNEALDSQNKEMEAMNEELKTTNEALDKSNKESEALNEELITTNDHLNEAIKELELARAALWTEMELAQKLQTVLLPEEPKIKGFDIAAFMVTNDKVGGDYYDVINVENKDWFLIGDVSGHGVTAGLIMMMVQTSIHVALSQNPGSRPEELLVIINKTIHSNIHKLGGKKYMTLTVFACLDNNRFSFAGAHLPLILYRSKTKVLETIETGGAWVGLVPDIAGMNKNDEFIMDSGDVLLLYTDGISESLKKSGEAFNQRSLSDYFLTLVNYDSKSICKNIKDLSEELEVDDDITVMVLKKD